MCFIQAALFLHFHVPIRQKKSTRRSDLCKSQNKIPFELQCVIFSTRRENALCTVPSDKKLVELTLIGQTHKRRHHA